MNTNDHGNVLMALSAVPDLFQGVPAGVETLFADHGIVTCEQALVYVRWLLSEDQREHLRDLDLDADVMEQLAERLLAAIHPGMAARLDADEGRLWLERRPLGVLPPVPPARNEADEDDGDAPPENGGGS